MKPVVTAVQGRALGGGCELVLYSPIVVAASETYIGLVEAGVGLLPSGGGLAEMADRILRTSHKFDDKQASMTKVLTNIAFAKTLTPLRHVVMVIYVIQIRLFSIQHNVSKLRSNVRNMKQKQTIFRILDINISL